VSGANTRTTVLGIDLATANARVVAVDTETGRIIAQAAGALSGPEGSGGEREQRADYAEVVRSLITEVVAALGQRAADIGALSITGTSGTVVPVDATGRPVGPALLYNDARGTNELRELAEAGFAVRPSTALARTAWMHRVRPAAQYVFTPDVVAADLTGLLVASDTSHALKSGIDPVSATWDSAALEILGLPEDHLPALVRPGQVVGRVSGKVAESLGLPKDVVIVSGMTDGCTSQLATGAVAEGDTVAVLGTTLVLKAVSPVDVTDSQSGVYSHVAPDGAFWAGGASNVGAGSLAGILPSLSMREADELARHIGPAPVVCYPLLGTGERFPVARTDLAEFVVDLSGRPVPPPSGPERYRALLEGVAFVERLGLERLEALGVPRGTHRLSGGASASGVWNGIRASLLNRPVLVPANRSSAFGAAILAAVGLLTVPLTDITGRLAQTVATVEPDSAQTEQLEERYQVFIGELRRRKRLAPA
jgi:sugar (pentulose or hexulose) kinase